MSRHAYELCTLLVDDIYGGLTSLLFRFLLRYGRLTLSALRNYTPLSERLIKHGLSVLVQHQLVLWYTADNKLTTYEANPEVAYTLLRSGKYVKIAEDRVGRFAGEIISKLLALGHTRLGDFVQGYGVGNERNADNSFNSFIISDKPQPNGLNQATNGSANGGITLDSIYNTLHELLLHGLVSQVNRSHFRSDTDNRFEAEKVVPPVEHYKAKSKKENEAQWETSVTNKLAQWKDGYEGTDVDIHSMTVGKKRPHRDTEDRKAVKRQCFDLSPVEQDIGITGMGYRFNTRESASFNDNIVLRINHAKFAAIMRNDHLIKLAEQSICRATSNVYAEVLHALEPKIRTCKGDNTTWIEDEGDQDLTDQPQISTDDLMIKIKDTDKLLKALGNVNPSMIDLTNAEHPKKRRRKDFKDEDEAMVNGDVSSYEDGGAFSSEGNDSGISDDSNEVEDEADYESTSFSTITKDPHRKIIRDHLLLLARHPHKYLHHFPQTPILPERWTINFPALINNMTHQTLRQTITSRFGVLATRITQVLFEQGKVGEKDLTAITLMPQKTMRSYLATLHKAGMIHLQEVPRDASRNPARTMYLWFFDLKRCKAEILEETYKTMARCLQRARVEGEKVNSTVEKANRSDVIGKEEQFLSIQEREALDKWRTVEERIWGEVGRLDDVLAVIRDY